MSVSYPDSTHGRDNLHPVVWPRHVQAADVLRARQEEEALLEKCVHSEQASVCEALPRGGGL